MENSKININREEMTNEEIERDNNFDKLLKKHSQIQRGRKLKVGGMALVGVFLLGLFLVSFLTKEKTEIKELLVENSFNKPFNFDIENKEYLVNNQKGDILNFNNSIIIIPANAFEDSNGNLIEGEVKLTYREFHNPVDFFVSGIPMTYDSAGYEYHFESAGMFEMNGFQNGKPVKLAKPIEVKLASFQEGNYFNKYYFDKEKNKWNYISKDVAELVFSNQEDSILDKKQVEKELVTIKKQIKEIEKSRPILKSKNSTCIKIEVDSMEFPEIVNFKNILFEIDKKDENFSPELAKIEWDDIKLSKKENGYELLFFDEFKRTIINAKPVLDNKEFAKAMKNYEEKNTTTVDNLKTRQRELLSSAKSFSNETAIAASMTNYVYRLFTVNNFGTYNSDFPRRLPKGQMIATLFTYQKEGSKKIDTLTFSTVYLVEENRNALYNLRNTTTISFNPNNKYVLWAVTNKEELAVFSAKKFRKIPKNFAGTYTFELDISDKKVFALEQVKKQLDIKKLFNDI